MRILVTSQFYIYSTRVEVSQVLISIPIKWVKESGELRRCKNSVWDQLKIHVLDIVDDVRFSFFLIWIWVLCFSHGRFHSGSRIRWIISCFLSTLRPVSIPNYSDFLCVSFLCWLVRVPHRRSFSLGLGSVLTYRSLRWRSSLAQPVLLAPPVRSVPVRFPTLDRSSDSLCRWVRFLQQSSLASSFCSVRY
jgi:hypothetical protein